MLRPTPMMFVSQRVMKVEVEEAMSVPFEEGQFASSRMAVGVLEGV